MSYPRALTRAVLCMLLSLMLLACEEGGKGAPGSSGPREVVIIKLEPRREVYTTALAGRIASFQVAEVRPQVGGILQQRLFTEGADVKAGQALYQIDPATYEAALDSAQAALMKAEANVTPARLKAERFRELLAIKAVSKQEYDDAQAAFKQAEADVAVNRAAVKTARINLDKFFCFPSGRTVPDSDGLNVVGRYHIRHFGCRLLILIAGRVGVNIFIMNQFAGFIQAYHFTTCTKSRIDSQYPFIT